MTTNIQEYILEILEKSKEYPEIPNQCSKCANPLYQDWRYNIICDTLIEFKNRGITKKQLRKWIKKVSAIYPWSNGYDIFRQNVNRRFIKFPWLIAMTNKESQVLDALNIAIKYKIPFCIRGGAHSYEPFSITDGLIIDQSQRTRIFIDNMTKRVTIEPGVLNGPLADKLGKYGLAIAQGTCANVGVVGLCLGGGMGFLGRKYGLTCDNLISFKILIADGRHLFADKNNNSDLFWACSGAGNGNFGIITELTIQAHHVPEVINFQLRWPFESLYDVLQTYFEWLKNDNDIGIEMDIYSTSIEFPIEITGIYVKKDCLHKDCSKNKLNKYLRPFFDLNPSINKIWSSTYVESARHFTYAKFPPPYFKNKSYYAYDTLPETVVPIIKKYMSMAGPNDRVELNGLGSAYKKVRKHDSAYIHRDAIVWIQYITRYGTNKDNTDDCHKKLTPGWSNEEIGPCRIKWVTDFYKEIKEVCGNIIKGAYVGCFDSDLDNYLQQYYGSNLNKLKKIKKKWDPNNKFKYPQSL